MTTGKAGANWQGFLALTATAALWGSNHVVARAAREAVPLPAMLFWRWFPAAIVLTIVALPALRSAWPEIRPRLRELVVGGVVGVGVFSYLLFGGAYQSLAIEVGLINATTPVWVALMASRSGEGAFTTAMKWGLVLALGGTVLIITKGRPQALSELHFNLGNLWSLLAAIAFAWFSIKVRGWTRVIDPLSLTTVSAWAGLAVVMLPAYLVWMLAGGPWLVFEGADLGFALAAIGYIAIGPTMLGNLFYLYGVAVVGPARAAAFLYLSPLFTVTFSVAWLGEEIAWFHVAGIAAIFAGLALLGRSDPKRVSEGTPSVSAAGERASHLPRVGERK